jgi:hypothetical protein
MALSGAIISFVSTRHTNCGLRLPSTYADKDEGEHENLCRAQGAPVTDRECQLPFRVGLTSLLVGSVG